MKNLLTLLLEDMEAAADFSWEKKITLQRGDLLKAADTKDDAIYFVQSGCFKLFVWHLELEQIIRFGYAGELLTALDSFISGEPSPIVIEALRKSEVWSVRKEVFMHYLYNTKHEDRSVLRASGSIDRLQIWHTLLENLIYQQLEREMDLLIRSPAERFKRVLERSPKLFQQVPSKYIANYLRMTPETLSRIQKSCV